MISNGSQMDKNLILDLKDPYEIEPDSKLTNFHQNANQLLNLYSSTTHITVKFFKTLLLCLQKPKHAF